MASKKTKDREIRVTTADFPVPLAELLAAHVDADDTLPGDIWSVSDRGDDVVFTRIRRAVLLEPEELGEEAGKR